MIQERRSKGNSMVTITSLFLLIIIDTMGISVVFPVFAPLLLNTNTAILHSHFSIFSRDIIYGISLAIFPLFMFFGAPLFGQLSDNIGRKKSLLICILGMAFGYFVSSFGIYFNSLIILLIGRALSGLFAGSQAIAQAAIADISLPEKKAFNMGMIVLAYSAGIILGPLLGGITSNTGLVSWFNYGTPFLLAAILAIINAILLAVFFKETFVFQHKKINLIGGVYMALIAFSNKSMRYLSVSYVCMILAWSLYFQTIGWFLLKTYHYTASQIGLFMGIMGVVSAISLTIGIRQVFKWLKTKIRVFIFCIILMGAANFLVAMTNSEIAQWLLIIPNAFGAAISYAVALTIFSDRADKNMQGWIMGITGSLTAIAWTLTAVLAGFFGYVSLHLPYFMASLFALFSCIFMLIIYRGSSYQINKNALENNIEDEI